MKSLIFILVAATFLVSCKKDKATEIKYPASMAYGENVLAIDSVTGVEDYSFGATLGKKAKLKIVITNLSTTTNSSSPGQVWFYSDNQGWVVSDYTSENTQTFTANKKDDNILRMKFLSANDSTGKCKIEYYENSDNVTKTKFLHW